MIFENDSTAINYVIDNSNIQINNDLSNNESSNNKPLYSYLFNPNNEYAKDNLILWSKYITTDKTFLKDTQLLIKNKQEVAAETRTSKGLIGLELHNRLHRPMFCFVAAILGFSTLLMGNYSRFGFGRQIALAISIIVVIKITESYTTKLSLQNSLLWPLIYFPSLIGIISSILFLNISASKYRLNYRASS